MKDEEEVRKTSAQFYEALNRMANGDAKSMSDIWEHRSDVTAMHPIGGRHSGWDDIKGSFDQVAQMASGGKIALKDQQIRVSGDLAYELGVEQGDLSLGDQQAHIEQRVTNIYHKEGNSWKMIHHHSDTSQEMQDVIRRLQNG